MVRQYAGETEQIISVGGIAMCVRRYTLFLFVIAILFACLNVESFAAGTCYAYKGLPLDNEHLPDAQNSVILICNDNTFELRQGHYCEHGKLSHDPMTDSFKFEGSFDKMYGIATRIGGISGSISVKNPSLLRRFNLPTLNWDYVQPTCSFWPFCKWPKKDCAID
jgi:hypothetical protein